MADLDGEAAGRVAEEIGRCALGLACDVSAEADLRALAVIDGVAAERFLILPHPEVLEHFRRKASDYDRWLAGMQRLRQSVQPAVT